MPIAPSSRMGWEDQERRNSPATPTTRAMPAEIAHTLLVATCSTATEKEEGLSTPFSGVPDTSDSTSGTMSRPTIPKRTADTAPVRPAR